jgi:hypothetical protein
VRLALNVAVGVALVALLAVAIATRPQTASGQVELGTPVRVHRVNWADYSRLFASVAVKGQAGTVGISGTMELDTYSVEIGPQGWRVHARIANNSDLRLGLRAGSAPGVPATYPQVPLSLVVQTDNGGGVKYLQPLAATQFDPPLPAVIGAHAVWKGTFAGNGVVKKGELFFSGFGQFYYADSPVQTLPLSVVSRESARG